LENEMLNWGRLLLDGIPFSDLLEAQRRDVSISWFDFWMAKAARYEEYGEQALAEGHDRSAGRWLWLGSLCCQYAQFRWFDEKRWVGQQRKVELYQLAAPYLDPPARRVSLRLDSLQIPGYLRRPTQANGPVGCAVLLGGLDSTKEESFLFENMLLERGLATFTFDGPGQGELLDQVPLASDFARYTSTVLDYLVMHPDIDGQRLGVLGRSVGGHFALQSACLDPRITACVSWGGFVVMDSFDRETSVDRRLWQHATRAPSEETAREIVQDRLDIRELLPQLRCPTYVLHGARDEIPLSQVALLQELTSNAQLTIVVEPAGDHCCHNLGPAPRVRMADWLADHLA
jgi:2,6-dihydroxypseudooxynicotine hydrolase